MRQIVEALGIKPQFEIDSTPQNLSVFTMTEYKKEFPFPVIFPPVIPSNTLAEWLSSKGLPQFHCAGMKKFILTMYMIAIQNLLSELLFLVQRLRNMLM